MYKEWDHQWFRCKSQNPFLSLKRAFHFKGEWLQQLRRKVIHTHFIPIFV